MAITFGSILEYVPYLNVTLIKSGGDCGCGKDACGGCDDCKNKKKCSCCKSGTVQTKDGNGEGIGCLSPTDATEYYNGGGYQCQPGYVQVFTSAEPAGLVFAGCMSQEVYNEYVVAGYIIDGLLSNTHP